MLRGLGAVIGLAQFDPLDHFQFAPEVNLANAETQGDGEEEAGLTAEQIEALIEKRSEARKNKNFAESDRIRDELAASGITVLDSKEGTTWRRN